MRRFSIRERFMRYGMPMPYGGPAYGEPEPAPEDVDPYYGMHGLGQEAKPEISDLQLSALVLALYGAMGTGVSLLTGLMFDKKFTSNNALRGLILGLAFGTFKLGQEFSKRTPPKQ